jgi:hypothetical protein
MSFPTPNFGASIVNEVSVTLEDVLKVGDQIWKKCREKKLDISNTKATDEYLAELRYQFPEFAQSYPIVLRYMVQMNSYKHKAFERYLHRIQKHPWTSEDEYLQSQADYVIILYKAMHPRWKKNETEVMHRQVLDMLRKEHYAFKEQAERVQQEVDEEQMVLKERNIAALVEFYKKYGNETMNVPIRTETDISAKNLVNFNNYEITNNEINSNEIVNAEINSNEITSMTSAMLGF